MENNFLKKARKEYNIMNLLSFVIVAVLFYFLLPYLLNFPKYFDTIEFQLETIKIPLFVYFILIGAIIFVFEKIIDKICMKKIDQFIDFGNQKNDKKFVIEVRENCMNYPYKFMVMQLIMMAFFISFVIIYFLLVRKFHINSLGKLVITIIRFSFLVISVLSIISVFKYYFLQKYLNIVLKASYVNNQFYKKNNKIISNSITIILQVLPMVISIFVIFVGFTYSNTVNVTSKAISTYYRAYMNDLKYDESNIDWNELLTNMENNIPLWDDSNVLFVIDYNDNFITSTNEELSDFMLNYKDKYFYYYTDKNGKNKINLNQEDNVIYESYGVDEHAYVKAIKDDMGRTYFAGVKYFAGNAETFRFLSCVSIGVLVIYTIILTVWAKNFGRSIKNLEENMKNILSDKDILKQNFMPILSNDEIGNVSYYYNKIQDKLLVQRNIMFKQEQLSVLGELAGGMAHDINTPISSINTSILILKKYYTSEKEKEILDGMQISADRIINIVTSMRNQIRNLGGNEKELFSLNKVVDDIQVLTQNEQKKNGCNLKSDVKENLEIYGERTKLGQVLTNIVVNSIQAYSEKEKKGDINLIAFKKEENICRIEIEDEAGGIPKKVQKYLFKNIMTTKGAKGTGLGLYLAGSIIKGIYQGEIWFEVKEGIGTKFIIEIPMKEGQNND